MKKIRELKQMVVEYFPDIWQYLVIILVFIIAAVIIL